jgi:AraC-like DNA-binding protein
LDNKNAKRFGSASLGKFRNGRPDIPTHIVALKRIIRDGSSGLVHSPGNRRARVRHSIERLCLHLNQCPGHSISLTHLAWLLDLERTYCCKVFQNITGKPFTDWMRSIRILKAMDLLADPAIPITEVSHMLGYQDITTFERNFRKISGKAPLEFQRTARRGPGTLVPTGLSEDD